MIRIMLFAAAFSIVLDAAASDLPPFDLNNPWTVRLHTYSFNNTGRHVWISSEGRIGLVSIPPDFRGRMPAYFPCTLEIEPQEFSHLALLVERLETTLPGGRFGKRYDLTACISHPGMAAMSLQNFVPDWRDIRPSYRFTVRIFPTDAECLRESDAAELESWLELAEELDLMADQYQHQCYASPVQDGQ